MNKHLNKMFSALAILALMMMALPMQSVGAAPPTELFFSEYIEGSSNNKALEIYNGTGAAVNLAADGYNVQMHFNGNPVATLTINLTGSVANGDVYVVAQSSANATILAQADQTNGSGWFNGDDAVVLRKGTTVIDVLGQIGFDPGTEWGTGLTSTADNTLRRKSTVCVGDPNGGDAFDPSFEWDGFAIDTFDGLGAHTDNCNGPTPPSGVGTATPNTIETGESTLLTVAVTPGTNPISTGLAVTADLSPIGGNTAQIFFDDGTNGDVTAGDNTFSYQTTATSPTACGATLTATITDAEARQGSAAITLTVQEPATIHEIQGTSHISPLNGKCVKDVLGVVTSTRSNGFNMQDPNPDGDEATSEGLFVFTSSAPTVSVGDSISVSGSVTEFRPGGNGGLNNLTTTEIVSPSITPIASGSPLPAPTVIGNGGRVPPTTVIEDDASGSVETSGVFDPAQDGIDFYESMEGMLVQVNDAVVVGPTSDFGEIFVLADNGANAGVRTARGGIIIQPGDFNPERIQFDDTIAPVPDANVGDHISSPAIGVLDYSFGNFEILNTSALTVVSGGLQREVTTPPGNTQLSVGTMNVENLDPNDPDEKFEELASLIVTNLQSPDILVVEEIQDNNGPTNDAVVDAAATFNELIAAIVSAGGPTYQFRQINPVDDQDGGEPGGNIRVGFLFRTDRGLAFVDRPGGGSTSATTVVNNGGTPELSASPGRIDPTNSAFNASRKPLVGEFTFNGAKLFVIANHFNSKGGDQPLFGHAQPPVLNSEVQRIQQAQVVNNFVDSILTLDPNANVVVAGDLNDFEFSTPVNTLEGGVLHTLMETLPPNERYSYVFEGNSQALDHILISDNLFETFFAYDVVHVNSEFADQASDHDPQVVTLFYDFTGFFQPVDNPPTFNTVKAGRSIPIKFSLNGDQGLNIIAAGYPKSEVIECNSTDPVDGVEETVTAGNSSLSYDPTTDTYTYVWKTNKGWANTCRQFVLKLADGTMYRANFSFTK